MLLLNHIIVAFWSILVHFGPIRSIWSNSVYFGPFILVQSIRFTWVQFGLFGPLQSSSKNENFET